MKSYANERIGLSRRTQAALSWAAVVVMLVVIFWMSAKSGNDLDHNSGIISAVKEWLAVCAAAIFGHEVDVSPIGHFTEYLLLGAALANALRFTPWTKFTTPVAVEVANSTSQADASTANKARVSPAGSQAIEAQFSNNAIAHPAGMLGSFPAPLVAALFCSFYGVTDEFHQIFTPSRSCDPMDWLVDTCAAAIGAAIVWLLLKKHAERRSER